MRDDQYRLSLIKYIVSPYHTARLLKKKFFSLQETLPTVVFAKCCPRKRNRIGPSDETLYVNTQQQTDGMALSAANVGIFIF